MKTRINSKGFSHDLLIVFVVAAVVIIGIGLKLISSAAPIQPEIQSIAPAKTQQVAHYLPVTIPLRVRIQEIAISQLGVKEDPLGSNHIIGNPYKSNDEPWCAYFASWVWREAGVRGINGKLLPDYGYTGYLKNWGINNHRWHPRGESYTPQVGDLVIFDSWVHTAIVDEVTTDGKIKLIAGNYNNRVTYQVSINKQLIDYQRNFIVTENNGKSYNIAGYVSPI